MVSSQTILWEFRCGESIEKEEVQGIWHRIKKQGWAEEDEYRGKCSFPLSPATTDWPWILDLMCGSNEKCDSAGWYQTEQQHCLLLTPISKLGPLAEKTRAGIATASRHKLAPPVNTKTPILDMEVWTSAKMSKRAPSWEQTLLIPLHLGSILGADAADPPAPPGYHLSVCLLF